MIHNPFHIFHEPFIEIDHCILHYYCILYLQMDQLLQEISKEEQKRYCALRLQADKINNASHLAINDLTEKGRHIEIHAHNLMLLCLNLTEWIPLENHQIDWKNIVKEEDMKEEELPKHIKAAAAFDPDWKHGVFSLVCKIDSEIPTDELPDFIHALAEEMSNDQVLNLILNHFLPHIEESPDEEMKEHIDALRKYAKILKSNTHKESHLEAKKHALMKWHHNSILTGPMYVTVWNGQEGNLQMDEVLTQLDMRVMAKLPADSTWKKGTVGTMNLVFTPMFALRWNHVHYKDNNFPLGIEGGGFFVCQDPIRLKKQKNPQIKRVACIKQQEWGIEYVTSTAENPYRREDWSYDLFLERKGDTDHYFVTCDVAPSLSIVTDKWQKQLLSIPDILTWCNQHNLTYVAGHDECYKVEMNTNFYSEFEALKKNLITKEQQLQEYKDAMEKMQRKYHALVQKVQDGDKNQSDEDVDHQQTDENNGATDSAVSQTVEMEKSEQED